MPEAPKDALPLDQLDIEGLLKLRDEINTRLPPVALADLNLEGEIVMQYHRAKALMAKVLEQADTPANQKAQVANSCASVLDQLIKMQARLYDAERVKAMEMALIKSLKTLPTETQVLFFDTYEKAYAAQAEAKK